MLSSVARAATFFVHLCSKDLSVLSQAAVVGHMVCLCQQ